MFTPGLNKKSGLPLYGLAVVLMLALMAGMRNCGKEWSGYDIDASAGDTVNVLIEYTPPSFYTYDDTLGGFDYDMLRQLAASHGFVLKFHPVVSLSRALATIEDGRADLLVAEVPMTQEYRLRYRFLEPVRIDRQVLVQRRDTLTGTVHISGQLDLAGDTVWVVDGSSVESRIRNLAHEIGDTIHVRTEPGYSSELLFIMTALGQIDRAVVSEQVAQRLVSDYPDIDISTSISLSQFQSWIAGSRLPWLADSLDQWISQYKNKSDYQKLLNRYTQNTTKK